MFADCDGDGNQHVLFEAIVDHKSDHSTVLDADRFVKVNGRQHVKRTAKG